MNFEDKQVKADSDYVIKRHFATMPDHLLINCNSGDKSDQSMYMTRVDRNKKT